MQSDGRFRHLLFSDDKPPLNTADDDPAYVKERLAKWIDSYQHGYFRDRINEIWLVCWAIVLGALISVVNVFSINQITIPWWVPVISAIFGAAVTILTGVLQFGKYHQTWVHHKITAAQLRREYYLWKQRMGEYSCDAQDKKECEKTNYKLGGISGKLRTNYSKGSIWIY